jgi:hypothetical protein
MVGHHESSPHFGTGNSSEGVDGSDYRSSRYTHSSRGPRIGYLMDPGESSSAYQHSAPEPDLDPETYCCEMRCFVRPRDEVDGRACDTCGNYCYCRCRCGFVCQRSYTIQDHGHALVFRQVWRSLIEADRCVRYLEFRLSATGLFDMIANMPTIHWLFAHGPPREISKSFSTDYLSCEERMLRTLWRRLETRMRFDSTDVSQLFDFTDKA